MKNARRRAALWYLSAANRLEKCGIVSRPVVYGLAFMSIYLFIRCSRNLWRCISFGKHTKCINTDLSIRCRHRSGMRRASPRRTKKDLIWSCLGLSTHWVSINQFSLGSLYWVSFFGRLGRLLYTTGDVAGAVRFFLGLLRGSSLPNSSTALLNGNGNGIVNGDANLPGTDKVYLDDFRVAFAVCVFSFLVHPTSFHSCTQSPNPSTSNLSLEIIWSFLI